MEADDNNVDQSKSKTCYSKCYSMTPFIKVDLCAIEHVLQMADMNACITKLNINTNVDDHGNLGRPGTTLIRTFMNPESQL